MTELLEQPTTLASEPETIEKVAIVVSKGSLEGIYPALILANGARMEGIEANLFFTFSGLYGILKKYMGGINADQARFVYDEYVELFDEFPVPREKGFQAVLDNDKDPKAKNFKPADFVDLSFLKEIDPSGRVEKIYKK